MSGIHLIMMERVRQIDGEGFTPEHDDGHTDGSFVAAADCYLQLATNPHRDQDNESIPMNWPKNWDISWWKPTTCIRNLEKAGALYQAEIDRLLRLRNRVAFLIDHQENVG